MKNDDAKAEFLLKEDEQKESLRKRVKESAFEYYTGRYLPGLIICGAIVAVLVLTQSIPFWGYLAFIMALIAQMEARRNRGRVDALVKLSNF